MTTRLVCILSIIGLTGCLSPIHATTKDGAQDHPSWNEVQLRECDLYGGKFQVPYNAIVGEMPDGFSPKTGDPLGQTALAYIVANSCQDLGYSNRSIGPGKYMDGYFEVNPPKAFQDPAINHYLLGEGGFADNAEFLHAMLDHTLTATSYARIDVEENQTPLDDGHAGAKSDQSSLDVQWTGISSASPQISISRIFVLDPGVNPPALQGYWDWEHSDFIVMPGTARSSQLADLGFPGLPLDPSHYSGVARFHDS
jgi:hypothetical protein